MSLKYEPASVTTTQRFSGHLVLPLLGGVEDANAAVVHAPPLERGVVEMRLELPSEAGFSGFGVKRMGYTLQGSGVGVRVSGYRVQNSCENGASVGSGREEGGGISRIVRLDHHIPLNHFNNFFSRSYSKDQDETTRWASKRNSTIIMVGIPVIP